MTTIIKHCMVSAPFAIYALIATLLLIAESCENGRLRSRCERLEAACAENDATIDRLQKKIERREYSSRPEEQNNKSQSKAAKAPQGLKQDEISRPDWEEMPLPFSDGVLVKATTNKNGRVVERYRTPDGKIHVVTRPKKRLFHNICDNMIAAAISSKESIAQPPMPFSKISKTQFFESLKTPIETSANDSDAVRELKDNVAFVKDEIKKIMLTENRDFNDILADHRDQWNANIAMRREVIKATRSFLREGDVAGAEKYLETANKKLSEYGYTTIDANTINRIGVGK